MFKTSEGEPKRSWLQRARPEFTASAAAEQCLAACPVDDTSVECWDPWDVWLRYIDQPRRLRAGRSSTWPVGVRRPRW